MTHVSVHIELLHDVTYLGLIHFELVQSSGFKGTVKFHFTFVENTDEVIVEKFAFFIIID